MGNYVQAALISEFTEGSKKKVTLEGKEIMLARVDGVYYAVTNKCPHMGGDLSTGKLEGNTITCPRHDSQFDVRNGAATRWLKGSGIAASLGKLIKPPHGLTTYKVKVEAGKILVEI
jgi:3-phenylpropionate/trans-cinnamate dioxygenase ferredoxin component